MAFAPDRGVLAFSSATFASDNIRLAVITEGLTEMRTAKNVLARLRSLIVVDCDGAHPAAPSIDPHGEITR